MPPPALPVELSVRRFLLVINHNGADHVFYNVKKHGHG
jgi:hypothetical protein